MAIRSYMNALVFKFEECPSRRHLPFACLQQHEVLSHVSLCAAGFLNLA